MFLVLENCCFIAHSEGTAIRMSPEFEKSNYCQIVYKYFYIKWKNQNLTLEFFTHWLKYIADFTKSCETFMFIVLSVVQKVQSCEHCVDFIRVFEFDKKRFHFLQIIWHKKFAQKMHNVILSIKECFISCELKS